MAGISPGTPAAIRRTAACCRTTARGCCEVLDAADANGMVAVLGYFYVSATPALADEAAVIRATDEITELSATAATPM